MYKIIGADGNEYGPVSADQLQQWIREGRASAQTKAQAEGSAEWKTLAEFPEFAAVFGAVLAPSPASARATATATEILAGDYEMDLGSCLGRAWALLKDNLGPLISTTLVYALILVGLALVGMIPIVGALGTIVQIIVGGPLMGGFYWVFIQRARGLPAAVGDLFAGFSRAFGHLILVQMVSGLLVFVGMLPGFALTAIGAVMMGVAKRGSHSMAPIGIPLLAIGVLLLVAGFCVAIYLTICWAFALPLVVDKRMGFWDAMKLSRGMVRKHWWGVFGFMFVMGLISSAGIIACGVGMLFTAPLAFAAIVYLYEDIFGGQPAQSTATTQTV
jgi:uncharacterized membrane protein